MLNNCATAAAPYSNLTPPASRIEEEVKCPGCDSNALYKYGHSRNGKQRFICLICNRQFVAGVVWPQIQPKERPACPACGKKMHCYLRRGKTVRFRCASYPDCRTFVKIETDNVKRENIGG